MATYERPPIVINDDRTVTVPYELKVLAIQYNHNVDAIEFDCPRYWVDIDLSTMDIYINYETADGKPGSHKCANVSVDTTYDDVIHFTWTIKAPVTEVAGKISFTVCAQKSGDEYLTEQRWHSFPCDDCEIAEGKACRNDSTDNAVVVPDNYTVDAQLALLRNEIENVKGMFLNYDSDGDGTVDNSDKVNGFTLNVDDSGVSVDDIYLVGKEDVRALEQTINATAQTAAGAKNTADTAANNATSAKSAADAAANNAANAQNTANAAMPKSGGTFTGAVTAHNANDNALRLRNALIQNGDGSEAVSTDYIIFRRK